MTITIPFTKDRPSQPIAVSASEALSTLAPTLKLNNLGISEISRDNAKASNVTSIDLSGNKLEAITVRALPKGLKELTVTGCSIAEFPPSFTSMARLEQLFAGANRLRSADVLFRLPALLHAGLSYNRIASLPPLSTLASCPLVSLDLSHNDLCDLGGALSALSALPHLRSLSLAGNPLCLLPGYPSLPAALPALLFLDGGRIEQPLAATTRADPAAVIAGIQAAAAAAGDDPCIPLSLNLFNLAIDEAPTILETLYPIPPTPVQTDPSLPPPDPPVPPQPKAVFYHVELALPDGTALASVASKVAPPEVEVVAADAGKGKAAPAAKGKGPAVAEVVEEKKPLLRGACTLGLSLPINVAGRDWLRSGLEVKLFRTYIEATSEEMTYMKELPPPKKGPPLPPVEVTELVWSYAPYKTVLLGSGRMVDGALLEGRDKADATIAFMSPDEPLFDANGVRLALKSVVGGKRRVAQMTVAYCKGSAAVVPTA